MNTIDCILVLLTALLVMSTVYYRFRTVVLRKKLETAHRNSAEIGNFMSLFSKNIRNVRDAVNWMNVTAQYVADTVNAVAVCIFSPDEEKSLILSGTAGKLPRAIRPLTVAKRRGMPSDRQEDKIPFLTLMEEIARQGESVLITTSKDPRLMEVDPDRHIRTLMAVPILRDGEAYGILCAVNSKIDSHPKFDRDQFRRLKFLSNQVVLAQNIMCVYSDLSKQQRLDQELQFARSLQRSLLPPGLPTWGRFTIRAFTRASKEVSGDFYDFVEIDEDRLLVVIGDACGKGIPACMIMSMTRSFIRANIDQYSTLKDLLTNLNDNLYRDMGDGRYITLGICLLNRKESTMEYARAGHTELLLYVHDHIRSINPDGAGLGLLPSTIAEFDTFCIELIPGMEMLLFTDGINEAINPSKEYFGVDRLKNIFVKSCVDLDEPHDTIARIMGAVDDFSQDPKSQADDQTLVIIRHV